MEEDVKRIVVVGGGITGLSAAYYARKLASEQGIRVDVTLFEAGARLGGKIRTLRRGGCLIEQGPDSFMARKLPILELTRELGLEGELVGVNPAAKTSSILHRGRLHPVPAGLMMGVPTEVMPFVKSGLISPFGKARAALDLLLPRRREACDESLGAFVHRRLGGEVLRQLTEPILAGIYAGDSADLSLAATFPQFQEIEAKHRSVILGMLAGKRASGRQGAAHAGGGTAAQGAQAGGGGPRAGRSAFAVPDIAKRSMFLTYRSGLDTLVERLVEASDDVRFVTGVGVERLERLADGAGYRLQLQDGSAAEADGVVLAAPAYEAARLLPGTGELAWLNRIDYASVANVVLAYDKRDADMPLNGSGFVVPRGEGRTITACTWISSKWQHAAPDDTVLIRVYVGRAGDRRWTQWSDGELLARVRADLRDTMGLAAEPLFHETIRLRQSMPQYPVGHVDRLRALRTQLEREWPGIRLCGAGYEGVGIPDCVAQGRRAAAGLVGFVASGQAREVTG